MSFADVNWLKARNWLIWVAIAVAYFWWPAHIDFYCDEGYFAEMASRVLRGELPNVDFASNYPGLFHWINAGWFHAFGVNVLSLRLGMLILVAGLFVPLVYRLARLMLKPVWACAATGMFMTLALSMNTTVSGNWYGLAFATLAIYGLLTKRPWLSGLGLGICFCLKQSMAIYTGMAMFLILLQNKDRVWTSWQKAAFTAVMGAYALVILQMLQVHPDIPTYLIYFLPVLVILIHTFKRITSNEGEQMPDWRAVGLGAAVFAVPVILCLVPYIQRNAVAKLIEQVFVVYPSIYLHRAYLPYTNFFDWPSMLVWLWFWVSFYFWRTRSVMSWGLVALTILIFVFIPIRLIFNSTSIAILEFPLWIMALGLWIYRRVETRDQQPITYACWIWAVILFLNTYPLGMPFYYAYSALPFILVAASWIKDWFHRVWLPGKIWMALVVAFACFYTAMVGYRQLSWYTAEDQPMFTMGRYNMPQPSERGKMLVAPGTFLEEVTWIQTIQNLSKRPDDVFLFSDSPGIYFLTHHINPTRYSYALDSSAGDGSDVVEGLERHNVQWLIHDQAQNTFDHPLLNDYLNANFRPYRRINETTLVFQRVPKPAH